MFAPNGIRDIMVSCAPDPSGCLLRCHEQDRGPSVVCESSKDMFVPLFHLNEERDFGCHSHTHEV